MDDHDECRNRLNILRTQWLMARDEIKLLRGLLIDAPVVIIDERAATIRGEDNLIAYMAKLREWHPRVQAALNIQHEGRTDD